MRRLTAVEQRVAWLDEHGTRGVDGIRIQLTEMAKDYGQAEGAIKVLSDKLDVITGRGWQRFMAYGLALLPVYVLLFLAVIGHGAGG